MIILKDIFLFNLKEMIILIKMLLLKDIFLLNLKEMIILFKILLFKDIFLLNLEEKIILIQKQILEFHAHITLVRFRSRACRNVRRTLSWSLYPCKWSRTLRRRWLGRRGQQGRTGWRGTRSSYSWTLSTIAWCSSLSSNPSVTCGRRPRQMTRQRGTSRSSPCSSSSTWWWSGISTSHGLQCRSSQPCSATSTSRWLTSP